MLKLCRAAALAAVVAVAPAFAASVAEDAQALINRGSYAEALRILDAHLAKNKQDAEARFTRGLALVKLNRSEEAIKVFAELTRDYPQLPEPYNNLAVLYAQQGDYEKARDALEAALATHPSYATAHENLGDIYAALAGAAYNRALMLDQGNTIVRRKLSLINQLDSSPADGSTVAVAPPRASVAAAPAIPPPAAPAVATTPPAPTVAIAPAPAPAAPMPAPAPAAALDAATTQAVNAAIQSWAQAWAGKNMDAYFALYGSDFAPEGGLTRAAWETQRRDRIARPKRISVKATHVELSRIDNGRVRASFSQEYESDAFSDTVTKVLELKPEGGGWKIAREYTR
ncbi:MAG TPA: tetratricopeptide repeat protein [Solimonas sp.]|nr:tetratricopeptide repeat protein [Solimonas sp.]